jgi:hypothetical protein
MRRIVTLVVVALVMAAMMVAMAMPAFAEPHGNFGNCHRALNKLDFPVGGANTNSEFNQAFNPPKSKGNQEGGSAECFIK